MKKIISDIINATSSSDNKLDATQAEATLKAALAGDTAAQGTLAALLKQEWPVLVKAAGNSDGAGKGHAVRKADKAAAASQAAHEASAKAHETDTDEDHEAASVSHEIASEAHKKAMLAHAKAGDSEQAGYHATAMAAHDACADAHGGDDTDTVTAALQKLGDVVRAGAPMGNQNAAGPHDGNRSGKSDEDKQVEELHADHTIQEIARQNHSDGGFRKTSLVNVGENRSGQKPSEHYLGGRSLDGHINTEVDKEGNEKHTTVFTKDGGKTLETKPGKDVKWLIGKNLKNGFVPNFKAETARTNEGLAKWGFSKASSTTSHDIVHCRASGSKLRADAAPDWAQDVPVEFCYMPGGLHTINAGFCGPITKGRAASINLTLDVDPDRDAAICQASAEALKAETPKQDIYGCYEHDEKKASLWAKDVAAGIFKSGVDPVHQEPCILLAAVPSGDGAADVNKKNWRSWSPSFSTNAEYTKCKCSRCEETISACDCEKPAFYFPPEARGSAEKPAQITGIDAVLGTLTNKPAFRAMPPVRAKHEDGTVTAGGPGSGPKKGSGSTGNKKSDEAWVKSEKAFGVSKDADSALTHASAASSHRDAAASHEAAAIDRGARGEESNKLQHETYARVHKGLADDHVSAMDKLAEKTKATATPSDLDTIIAGVSKPQSLDAILAGMTPDAGQRSMAADLEQADAVLKAVNGIK